MRIISNLVLPLIVISIVIYSALKKTNLYASFLKGAKDGLIATFNIAPSMIAMILAINIFIKSGFLEWALSFVMSLLAKFDISSSLLPLALLRPLSGSATLAILNDILATVGPDSFSGFLASCLQACTDTTLYIVALYFGSQKITKTRHAIKTGLLADLIGIIISVIVVSIIF